MKKLLLGLAVLTGLGTQGAYAWHDTFKNDTPWAADVQVTYFGLLSPEEFVLQPGQSYNINAGGHQGMRINSTIYPTIVSRTGTLVTETAGTNLKESVPQYRAGHRGKNALYLLRAPKHELSGEIKARWVRSK